MANSLYSNKLSMDVCTSYVMWFGTGNVGNCAIEIKRQLGTIDCAEFST